MVKFNFISLSGPVSSFIALIVLLLLAGTSSAQVQIQSVGSTVSTCPNNGTITINATSPNSSLIYSITGGPVTQPEQSSPEFTSLPPGTYTVVAKDISTDNEDSETVTISGNYTPLAFNPQTSNPSCPGDASGTITGNRRAGTGNGPYTWEIIAPAAYATSPQSSDTFENLPAGDYTVRLTDNCQSYTTQVVTVRDNPSDILFTSGPFATVKCNETELVFSLNPNNYSPPYNITIESPHGTHTISDADTIWNKHSPYIHFQEAVPDLTYGDNVKITITDKCNRSISHSSNIKPFEFCPSYNTSFTDCQYVAKVEYKNTLSSCLGPGNMWTYLNPPLSYQFVDVATGTVAESGTITDSQSGINGVTLEPVTGGKLYEFTITDNCGNSFTDTYTPPALPTPVPNVSSPSIRQGLCLDSTAFVNITANNFKSKPKMVFLSGPDKVSSTKPGYSYSYNHNYPDTIPSNGGSTTSPSSNFQIKFLPPGVYTYKIIDTCGTEIPGSFEVKPEEVSDFSYDISYKQGCLGTNQINFETTATSGALSVTNNSIGYEWRKIIRTEDDDEILKDSVVNLSPGTYSVSFSHSDWGGETFHDSHIACKNISESVTVEAYQSPQVQTYNQILCGNSISVELIPDSSKGVPPYQYEIIAGPQTFPVQDDNIFELNSTGAYKVRIYDDCGNASTRDITLEGIEFTPQVADISCTSARIIYPSSSYYTHKWQKPDNSTYTGDTLLIPTTTPADTGTYYVSQIVEISGCRDTFSSSYHIEMASRHSLYDSICMGETYVQGTSTYNSSGIYTDTLTNALGCDSIVELHLKVKDYLRGSQSEVICPGGSITIRGQAYTTPGTYYDTLPTTGCDSIVSIDISFSDYLRGTENISICPERSVKIRGKTYDSPGTYYDTVYTGTCDSVIAINVTERDYLRGSVSASVCRGKTITIAGHTYDEPGTYYDTLFTTACDSILTVNISEKDYLRGYVNESICPGEDIVIGGHTYSTPGTYYDTIPTADCDSVVTINIDHYPSPVTDLGPDISLCQGDSVILDAGSPNAYYYWNNSSLPGSRTLTARNTGKYKVMVENSHGCTSADSMEILSILPLPVVNVSAGDTICYGDTIRLSATGGTSYSWRPGNKTGANPSVNPPHTTTYTVTAYDANNCASSPENVTVHVHPKPAKDVFESDHITHCFAGGPLEIGAQWGQSFHWSGTADSTRYITIYQQGTYQIEVMDEMNCSATGEIFVEDECVPQIFVPTAFSPNYDGLHDRLEIYGKNFTHFEMRIFNRWGEIIFLTDDPDDMWDGKYRNELMPVGSYPWVIQYKPLTADTGEEGSGLKRLTGSVTLIR